MNKENIYKKEGYVFIKEIKETLNRKRVKSIISKDGYYFISVIQDFIFGNRPNIVDNRNPYSIQNIHNFIKLNNIKSKLVSNEYINNKTKLLFQCECGEIYKCVWGHFRDGWNWKCQKCGYEKLGKSNRLDIDIIKQRFLDNELTPIFNEYKGADSLYTVKNKDGYTILTKLYNLEKLESGNIFHVDNPYTIENIKHYIKIHKLNCELLSNKYLDKKSKLRFKCNCEKIFLTSWDSFIGNNKIRCSKCTKNQSSIELLTEDWLINNKIHYKTEYRFNDCRNKNPLPFDFYLSELNTCIEVDGIYHYKKVKHTKDNYLEQQQMRDKIKSKYCKDKNINLIRIPYWEFRDNNYIEILNNFLKE